MNIFALSESPQKSAEYMFDKHVIKMITESSQMIANAYSLEQLVEAPKTQKNSIRKYGYYNHPSSVWVRESEKNFKWLLDHALHLVKEAIFRGYNLHFCFEFLDWCVYNTPNNIKNFKDLTPFALAMPDEYKKVCPIESYRTYYINDKQKDKNGKWMMKYSNREYPEWFPDWLLQKCKENNDKVFS